MPHLACYGASATIALSALLHVARQAPGSRKCRQQAHIHTQFRCHLQGSIALHWRPRPQL